MKPAAALLLAALIAGPALARDSAPQPAKAVAAAFYTGRWYEIARTENVRQQNCEAPTYDFGTLKGTTRAFVLTCRRGSPTGKAESTNISVTIPTDAQKNKFRIAAFGGVVRQEYWVLDRADDLSWAIMATPGGNYVWLLSRSPRLDPGLQAQLMTRIRGLGYDMSKIVQPKH